MPSTGKPARQIPVRPSQVSVPLHGLPSSQSGSALQQPGMPTAHVAARSGDRPVTARAVRAMARRNPNTTPDYSRHFRWPHDIPACASPGQDTACALPTSWWRMWASRGRRRPETPVPLVAFHENPAPALAARIIGRGGLWNSFVMVGRVARMLELVRELRPGDVADLEGVAGCAGRRVRPARGVELLARLPGARPTAPDGRA